MKFILLIAKIILVNKIYSENLHKSLLAKGIEILRLREMPYFSSSPSNATAIKNCLKTCVF